jgi:hypothetical protein
MACRWREEEDGKDSGDEEEEDGKDSGDEEEEEGFGKSQVCAAQATAL